VQAAAKSAATIPGVAPNSCLNRMETKNEKMKKKEKEKKERKKKKKRREQENKENQREGGP